MNRKYDWANASSENDVCCKLSEHPEWHVVSICMWDEGPGMYCGLHFRIFYYTEHE